MKYTVWVDYGSEGWHPTQYESLMKAIKHESYGGDKRITIDVHWEFRYRTDRHKIPSLESESGEY